MRVFHSTFWAFLCLSQAPFGRSLWSGYYCKGLFLLHQLSMDNANFGQNWWRQKWKKGQGSSREVTASTGGKGLMYIVCTCMFHCHEMVTSPGWRNFRKKFPVHFSLDCCHFMADRLALGFQTLIGLKKHCVRLREVLWGSCDLLKCSTWQPGLTAIVHVDFKQTSVC